MFENRPSANFGAAVIVYKLFITIKNVKILFWYACCCLQFVTENEYSKFENRAFTSSGATVIVFKLFIRMDTLKSDLSMHAVGFSS